MVGSRVFVVGMPNVGKSTLLNSLRSQGVKKAKAAVTGAQPGVTRKIGTEVKILEGRGKNGEGGVYILDTPGRGLPEILAGNYTLLANYRQVFSSHMSGIPYP
jgi:hypothetical protein